VSAHLLPSLRQGLVVRLRSTRQPGHGRCPETGSVLLHGQRPECMEEGTLLLRPAVWTQDLGV